MEREIELSSLEREYKRDDRLCLDAEGCRGCSYCCENVGKSIILDPYDIFQMQKYFERSFDELLSAGLMELHIVDGLMLPNLSMRADRGCGFLTEEGSCSIHSIRPGYCRMFPLARVFHSGGFNYILQGGQCVKELKGERQISEWLGIEGIDEYESFVLSWHDFRRKLSDSIGSISMRTQKKLCSYVLQKFFKSPYSGDSFYEEYYKRLDAAARGLERLLRMET